MVVGGSNAASQDVQLINLDGAPCPKPSNVPPEYGSSGVYIDGKVLLIGGTGADSSTRRSTYTYDAPV